MNLQLLKILKDNLVYTGFRDKFNKLLDKVIYEIVLVNNNSTIRFKTADGNIDLTLPVPSLNEVRNVNINSPQIGNTLVFDGTEWKNQTVSADSVDTLSDTEITNKQDNDTVVWDETLGKWVNKPISVQNRLNDLLDVLIDVNLEEDDVLVYDGTQWINKKITGLGYNENNDYLSNNFIQDGKSYNETLSDLDQILSLISPTPSETLTGKSLSLTGTTLYNARLSAGLPATWYEHPTINTAGDLITNYITDNTYRMTSPSQNNTFRVGKKDTPVGEVQHELDGTVLNTKTITIPSSNNTVTDTKGETSLTVSSETYNSIWQKANAFIDFTQYKEGYIRHRMKHVENGVDYGGTTNVVQLWYDNNGSAIPSFSSAPTHTVGNKVVKYLSGIEYFGHNSTFNINYTAAQGIFSKCYHPNNVSIINSTFMNAVTVNPQTVPNFNDSFVVSNQLVTFDKNNLSSGASNGVINVTLYRPNGATKQESTTINGRVNTYGIDSTLTRDRFFDEDKRLVLNTNTAFNSTQALPNGAAQVRNGSLVYGNVDYASKSGEQEYQRKFTKASASNGVINFGGININSISSFGTGNLNVLLWLEGSNKYFDLGRDFGSNNGSGSGNSRANSLGAKNTANSSGSNLAFSFGLYNTADLGNNNQYRILVIFRDTTGGKTLSISSLTTS